MARKKNRRGKPLPTEMVELTVAALSHEGRGIGQVEGKKVFIDGALPGEKVKMKYTYQRGKFDEGRAVSIGNPNSQRVIPSCQHFGVCGGCSLQHLSTEAQIAHKQAILKEQFAHFAQTQPQQWLDPLQADLWGYRRKARLGVKYVAKKERTLIGFREKHSNFLADIDRCPILIKEVSQLLKPMSQLINGLNGRLFIPQIELACGDHQICFVVRHLQPMSSNDRVAWIEFAAAHDLIIYLQPKGPKSLQRIWPLEDERSQLSYCLEEYKLEMLVHPLDFTQVNTSINQRMVSLALELLDLQAEDILLDLFCGLGNFTLPLATKVKQVVGIELVQEMVDRGIKNAQHNQLTNVEFFQADLTADLSNQPWIKRQYNKILIDPARSGALEVIANIVKINPQKIVYVSCNPATLARDTGELVKAGYRLIKAGVMDMFPHTTHVESIALFEK